MSEQAIMSETILLHAIIMICVGFFAMRLAGRKSLSQMTIAQTVIMIAVGSILVEPVKSNSVLITICSIMIFILVLILLEWISFIFPKFERWFVGEKRIIIYEGEILHENLKKLRMTKEILEMNLRLKGIADYSKIHIATMETNGHIGIKLKDNFESVDKHEFKKFEQDIFVELDNIYLRLKNIEKLLEGGKQE